MRGADNEGSRFWLGEIYDVLGLNRRKIFSPRCSSIRSNSTPNILTTLNKAIWGEIQENATINGLKIYGDIFYHISRFSRLSSYFLSFPDY
jgi:hypothetical protein